MAIVAYDLAFYCQHNGCGIGHYSRKLIISFSALVKHSTKLNCVTQFSLEFGWSK